MKHCIILSVPEDAEDNLAALRLCSGEVSTAAAVGDRRRTVVAIGTAAVAPGMIAAGTTLRMAAGAAYHTARERRTSKAFVERKAGWTASVIESVTNLYCHSVEMVGKKDKLVFIVPQV